jgi:type IX secretion system PorP/SprF family membrane protein
MKSFSPTILTLLLFVSCLQQIQAQDVRFSQPFANPLRLNPAIMGASADLKTILNYRKQWAGVSEGYKTASFSFIYPFFLDGARKKFDIGFNILNDRAGAFNNMDLMLALNYTFRTSSSSYLSFALTGGYVQKSISMNKLTFDEQYSAGSYDPTFNNGESLFNQKSGYADLGFGTMWYVNGQNTDPDVTNVSGYIGFAGYHLNKPTDSFLAGSSSLPRLFAYQAGVKVRTSGKFDFTPNIRYATQGITDNLALGIYLNYRSTESFQLMAGGWYRKKDAIAWIAGLEFKGFSFYYSYDLGIPSISNYIRVANAHEMTLIYKIDRGAKRNLRISYASF